jgi:hypothetical protein
MTRYFLLFFLIAFCSIKTHAYSKIILIGINGTGAPSTTVNFENRLRSHLSSIPQLRLEDNIQSQRYRRLIDFSASSYLSTEKLNSLNRFIPDSALLVWVNIKKYSVNPERKYLVWSKLKGKMIIDLNIYYPQHQEFIHSGDIEVFSEISAEFVMFQPVSKAVHITAIERSEILNDLEQKAVHECGKLIMSAALKESPGDDELIRNTKGYNDTQDYDNTNTNTATDELIIEGTELPFDDKKGINATEEELIE